MNFKGIGFKGSWVQGLKLPAVSYEESSTAGNIGDVLAGYSLGHFISAFINEISRD